MKIFLDANVVVAACGSRTGGSHYLFEVAAHDSTWHLLTTELALQEARKNVLHKLPLSYHHFETLVLSYPLTIIQSPPKRIISAAQRVINPKDAPILAAAVVARADYLCTLDMKDFHVTVVHSWAKKRSLKIVTPGDLLTLWRADQKKR